MSSINLVRNHFWFCWLSSTVYSGIEYWVQVVQNKIKDYDKNARSWKKEADLCTKCSVTWSNIKMSVKWQKEPVLNHLIFPVILHHPRLLNVSFPRSLIELLYIYCPMWVLSFWEISVIKIGYNRFLMSLLSDVSSFPSLITLLKCKPEDDTPLLKWSPPNPITLQINCLFSLACECLYSLTPNFCFCLVFMCLRCSVENKSYSVMPSFLLNCFPFCLEYLATTCSSN